MAEFCLDCLRRMDGINYKRSKFIISWERDLCEGCGQGKRVVVAERRPTLFPLLGELIATLRDHSD